MKVTLALVRFTILSANCVCKDHNSICDHLDNLTGPHPKICSAEDCPIIECYSMEEM